MNDHIIQYGVIMNLLSPIKKSFFRTLENGFNVFLDGKQNMFHERNKIKDHYDAIIGKNVCLGQCRFDR